MSLRHHVAASEDPEPLASRLSAVGKVSVHSSFKFCASVALVCGCVVQVRADNMELASRDIENVIVTGTRSDTRLLDIPLYTTVVSQEDINKSPAQALDQLLRNVPGMNF